MPEGRAEHVTPRMPSRRTLALAALLGASTVGSLDGAPAPVGGARADEGGGGVLDLLTAPTRLRTRAEMSLGVRADADYDSTDRWAATVGPSLAATIYL